MKNIFQLISLSPKIKSIFPIVTTLDKIQYEFKNGVILEVPKKLGIMVTNPLISYLIVKVCYTKLLLITKLIFIGIKFKVLGEVCYTYGSPTKTGREIRPS